MYNQTLSDSYEITPDSLGNESFKKEYNLKYAYVAGAMYKGISSEDLVVKMGNAGMMGYFGAGGLDMRRIEESIQNIQKRLNNGQAYGLNMLHNPFNPKMEDDLVDLLLKHKVRNVESAAYTSITKPLAKFRIKGMYRNTSGRIVISNKIQAKLSRPEVAQTFMNPIPEELVQKLLAEGEITDEQAELAKMVPAADNICVEADSGGHTDQGVALSIFPAILKLRDRIMNNKNYFKKIGIGAAGGIGTPQAASAAFIMGADFILTGSINQCTVEAGTSPSVKDMLQGVNVQDTEYAPAGDMFETGAKIQVLKKGVLFPARANKLYDLYRHCNSLEDIDEGIKTQIQEKYFMRDFNQVWEETKDYFSTLQPQLIEKAENNPKYKMALIFRWYFGHTTYLSLNGDEKNKVNYQVHCGPALGSFNQWVKGTAMEDWQNRHVDEIAIKLMQETSELLYRRFESLLKRK